MEQAQPISRQRAWQLRNQSKGRCVTCGDVAQYRQTRCQPCAVKNHLYQQELRDMLGSILGTGPAAKNCFHCGSEFQSRWSFKIYCSKRCKDRAWNDKKRIKRSALTKP